MLFLAAVTRLIYILFSFIVWNRYTWQLKGSCPSPGFIPVCSLGVCQVARMNFGKDVSTLKYFTICGLQEGFEPFAVNMNRDVTMWLSKRLPQFVPVPPNHQHIEVRTLPSRLPAAPRCTDAQPTLKKPLNLLSFWFRWRGWTGRWSRVLASESLRDLLAHRTVALISPSTDWACP